MRADQKTTADVLTQLVAAEVITVDEARARISYPPLPADQADDQAPDVLPPVDQTAAPVAAPPPAAADAAAPEEVPAS
jgi:hypothetical protein